MDSEAIRKNQNSGRREFEGTPVSGGIAVGRACLFGQTRAAPRRTAADPEAELARLAQAIEESRRQLKDLSEKVRSQIGEEEARIFQVHIMFLDDPYFREEVKAKLDKERVNVEAVIYEVVKEASEEISQLDDPYMRERAQDIRDVGRRILDNLSLPNRQCLLEQESEIIVVAEELSASDAVALDASTIKGFVTERGGVTSHVAVLARSMGVPLVILPQGGFMEWVELGDTIRMNGSDGTVILRPEESEVETARTAPPVEIDERLSLENLAQLPAETRDGSVIRLMANIATEGDVPHALRAGAYGVGLFRTEYLFLAGQRFPSEDEQLVCYRSVAEIMAPLPVTIRTLDIGGDKYLSYFPAPRELNPFLGWRALRISLEYPEVMKTQVRAILRASVLKNVKLLLPMVSSLEDVDGALRIIDSAKDELLHEGHPFDERMPIGIMIEVPSAALASRSLIRSVDFFSVGTNDLIQYLLAVDRSNARVSRFYEPVNPAVISVLRMLADVALEHEKEISICGEMAADDLVSALLVGLGYKQLSMGYPFLPTVKRIVRNITLPYAKATARTVLGMRRVRDIRAYLAGQRLEILERARLQEEVPPKGHECSKETEDRSRSS